jgi:hypothetical protein
MHLRLPQTGRIFQVIKIVSDTKEEVKLKNELYLTLRRFLVTANIVPISPIFVTLIMEALSSSETSDLIRATRRNFPEELILFNGS